MKSVTKILVVDDETHMCKSVETLLAQQEYEIWSSQTGQDAIDNVVQQGFDLVLLDLKLPDMDGHKVMREIMKNDPDTSVIILTGDSSTDSAIAAMKQGAFDYLRKPYDPDNLVKTVQNAIRVEREKKARKRAEESLRKSEERYRRLAENAKDMIYRMTVPDGRYDYVSSASIDLLGYKPEAFYNSPMLIKKVIHPDWLSFFEEQWTNLINGKLPLFFEYKIIHKSGEERWMHQRNVLVSDKHGKPQAIEGIVTDITEHKKVIVALQKSESKMQEVLDATPFPIAVVDLGDDRIFYWSQSARTLFGHTAPTASQWYRIAYPDPDYRREVIKRWKPLLESARACSQPVNTGEYRVTCKDGSEKICELYATFISDSLIITFNDVTASKQAERRIKEQLDFQETLLNTLPYPVFYKSKDGKYLGCNTEFEKFIGRTKEEIVGKTVYDMGPREIADKYMEKDQELFQSEGRQSYEWKVNASGGEQREVIFDKAVFYDAKKEPAGLIGVISDLTERKQAEREKQNLEGKLRQAHKMEAIGTLAGGIAHDFNNILTPVIIQTELALLNVPDDSPMKNSLHEVLEASHRAKDLVKQILTFSRRTETERVPLTIAPIVKEALKLLRSTFPTTIEIEEHIQAESGTVLADPTQVHQVLMNLCTNAAHAMREKGGVLDVSLSETEIDTSTAEQHPNLDPGNYAKLSISDTGIGIDLSVVDRIFEPFFTTKNRGEGTGMGLSVVHGIAKSYGGTVEVDTKPGKGTTFHVFFPMTPAKATELYEGKESIPTGTERIMLVDDEVAMVRAMEAMLKKLGYSVVSRTSSIEALEAFRAKPNGFDLVITDITMPNMRGDQLAEKIKGVNKEIPIILCTGFSEMISAERAKSLGIEAYVMKPIVMKDMAQTIRKVLDPEGKSE